MKDEKKTKKQLINELVELRQSIKELKAKETEHKRVEDSLSKSEELFRLAFDNANIGMCIVGLDGRLKRVNNQMCEIFGYSKEELENMTVNDIAYPEDLEISPNFIQRAISGEIDHKQFEKRYFHKQGHIVWCRVSSSLVRDSHGEPLYFISHVQDITDHKQAEETLKEIGFKFRSIFDFSSQAIALTDLETGRLIDVNNKFCELTKYAKKDVIGRNTIECGFYSEDDRNRFIKELLGRGEVQGLEMDFKARDSSILNTLMFSRIIQIRGESFILSIFVDITTRKHLEEQLRKAQKMEAVGQLAGGIAHDFNNILQAVIGYASLIKMKMREDDPLKHDINSILSSSGKAAQLVQDLLAFSRKQIIDLKPVNLNGIVKKIENRLLRLIGENIEFQTILAGEDLTVKIDSGQIEQVLMNLAMNARDAMPNGGLLTITTELVELGEDYIKTHGYGSPGIYALISVIDTGIGMDEKTRERIFEPFFTTREIGKGTGLGLSIVYGVVKQHEGYINVYSELGKGATFKIYLPVIKS